MFDAAIAFDEELFFEGLRMEQAEDRDRIALTFEARRGGHPVSMVVTCDEVDAPTIASGLLAARWVRPKATLRFAHREVAAVAAD